MNEGDQEVLAALMDRIDRLEERVSSLEGKKKRPSGKPDGSFVFDAYAAAYQARWGVLPTRNAAMNNQAAALVARVGRQEAIALVEFYLLQNDQFYTKNCHPIGLCLKDYQMLMVRMSTGTKVTSAQAKLIEDTDSNSEAVKAHVRKKYERKQSDSGE